MNDKSIKIPGGLQRIKTIDGYVIPLNIKAGLPYMTMRPYTDQEWEDLPNVIMTSDINWDPSQLDHNLDDYEQWFDAISELQDDPLTSLFDEFGNYRKQVLVNESTIFHPSLEDHLIPTEEILYQCHEREVIPKEPNYEKPRPYFGWLPINIIKRTFENTTQLARMLMSTILQKRYKSPFPALNVHRRNEPIATDTVYSDTPAIDCGYTSAQIFVGTEPMFTDVYGMKSDKQFVNTLENVIRECGAPTKLVSDRAQVEISNKVVDILRNYCIGSWQSEPHQQHRNPAERRYQTLKTMTNKVMDRTGTPANLWLLALMYVVFILNNTASPSLNYITPSTYLSRTTNDISPILRFHWYEPVYYKLDDYYFPSESRELRGRFVGIAENVGHAMTIKVLMDDTKKIIYRSNVRSALDKRNPNLRLDPLNISEKPYEFIKQLHQNISNGETPDKPSMPIIEPADLIGRSFLLPEREDGEHHRTRIVELIKEHDNRTNNDANHVKFKCSVNNDQYKQILAYDDIMNFIEKDDSSDPVVWKFKIITAHEGPIDKNHPSWRGSSNNVMIEWENGEITSETLNVIAANDPVTCAIYADENELLELPGWRRFRTIAKKRKKMIRMAN